MNTFSKDVISSVNRAHKSYLERKREEEKVILKIKDAEKVESAKKKQKIKNKMLMRSFN